MGLSPSVPQMRSLIWRRKSLIRDEIYRKQLDYRLAWDFCVSKTPILKKYTYIYRWIYDGRCPTANISCSCGVGLGLDAFCFAIALCYAITDISALLSGIDGYPLAVIYAQATGSAGGTFGLLFILFVSTLMCCVGTVLTVRDFSLSLSPLFAIYISSSIFYMD